MYKYHSKPENSSGFSVTKTETAYSQLVAGVTNTSCVKCQSLIDFPPVGTSIESLRSVC